MREPWQDLPKDTERPFVCHRCGADVGEDEGWSVFENKKNIVLCDHCIRGWAQEHGSLARHFIEEKEQWGEFLDWWIKWEDPVEKYHILRKAYEQYVAPEDKVFYETEFATQDSLWTEFVVDETEGSRL